MNSDFDSSRYKEFLNELHSITCIDSRILDNLIKLQLIQDIFVHPDAITISSDSFSLEKEYLFLKNNYKELPEFIFASYPLYNRDFQLLPFAGQFNTHKYQLFKYKCDFPIVLYFVNDKYSNDLYIDILFHINLKHFSDFNIELLSPDEKLNFQYYINNQLRFIGHNHSIYNLSLNSEKYYFMQMNSHTIENFQHSTIDVFLKQKETEFTKLSESVKTLNKEEINKLFQPALLRKEMNNF